MRKTCLITSALLILVCVLMQAQVTNNEEFVGPLSNWRSVKDFGATGDGNTDDTKAIQDALDSLKSVQTNTWSTLYFPAGNYKITNTLLTTRVNHHDYLGANIVGADPATTTITWAGASGGTMFSYDAWFQKTSRITFDGKGTAKAGLTMQGKFATRGEISDLFFKDFTETGLNLGGTGGNGIAETAINRCHFLRCGTGIYTSDWNTLDIWVRFCYFEDCGRGIHNGSGGYHAYSNTFVRSKQYDIGSQNMMFFSIIDNTSINSNRFIDEMRANTLYLSGNKIYNTTDSISILVRTAVGVVMLDNVIKTNNKKWASISIPGTNCLAAGNTISGAAWPIQPLYDRNVRDANNPIFPNQGVDKLIDNNPSTAFNDGNSLMTNPDSYEASVAQWNCPLNTKQKVVSYTITASDNADYSPRDFTLSGSNDFGHTWVVLDTRTANIYSSAFQKKTFTISTPNYYGSYKLEATSTKAFTTGHGSLRYNELELINDLGIDITDDKGGVITGRREWWGNLTLLEQKNVSATSIIVPEVLPYPETQLNKNRKIFNVVKGTGNDAAEIQAKINLAALEPLNSNPVVYIPKGNYNINNSIVIPANAAIQLIGDGANENGTNLNRNGADTILILKGPNRSTIRDIRIWGDNAMRIEDTDLKGGQIYCDQLHGGGSGEARTQYAVLIDGVENTDITSYSFGMASTLTGLMVKGGSKRSAGQAALGQVVFMGGGTSNACRLFDVQNNGELVADGMWYEGNWDLEASLIDLSANSSGKISLSSMLLSLQPGANNKTIFGENNFNGNLTVLSSCLDYRSRAPMIELSGNGSNSKIYFANNYLYNGASTADSLWHDVTSPAAPAAFMHNGTFYDWYNNINNKVENTTPDTTFIKAQIAQLRATKIKTLNTVAAGLTDVKLLRIEASASANKTGLHIVSTASGAVSVSGISVSPKVVSLVVTDHQQLSAFVEPIDATTKNISWESSNDSIATVDQTGVVTAISKGTATITATTSDGNFSDYSTITVTTATGLDSDVLNNTFEFYPNPATNLLYIKNASNDASISILTLQGHLIKTVSNSVTIDISGLSNGTYILRVVGENGPCNMLFVKH